VEYKLSLIVSLSVFTVLDLIVLSNSLRKYDNSGNQKTFLGFACAVSIQQLFSLFTQLADIEFNKIGNAFTYFAYAGALIFMTMSSFYCFRYLQVMISGYNKLPVYKLLLLSLPIIIITVTALLSPINHWLFYVDESGIYQRGKLFVLQMLCPYVYIAITIVLGFAKRKSSDYAKIKKMRRFFIFFLIPSIVGVLIQMFIVKGGYSSVGISIGLLLMYLEIYIEDVSENKRLKSIEALNEKLQTRMNVIQSMSRVYFVSFYADIANDSFTEISNTDFVRKYVGANGSASQALQVFCKKMVHPQYTDELLKFVDFSTLNERMKNKEFITCDYLGNVAGWCQVYFIAGNRDSNGNLETVFLAARTIHDEKERELAQTRELNNARIAAETANAAKTVFLNNMSHDIRTPLNAILGFSDLMAKEKDNPKAVEDYLAKIKTSGEYLLSIINNVLDMARIESGKVAVENSFMDLLAEAESTRTYVGNYVESANRSFSMDTSIIHRYIMIDAAKHQQIMMNLISNAVKYTNENGHVQLRLDELPCSKPGFGTYRMTVEDDGIGMSPEFLQHIFDSFSRERNTTDSKIIGTGLGMSIVKRLVDLLGGNIEIESEKGKGSKFFVTCDFELVDEPISNSNNVEQETVDASKLVGRRILITEDNELNAEIATAIMEDAGFVVEHAENGLICIDMVNNAPEGYYDLILMDIQMPQLNGYDTTRQLRSKGVTIPIIAMTANAFEEDRRAALDAGMNEHIAKPIDAEKLKKIIASFLVSSN